MILTVPFVALDGAEVAVFSENMSLVAFDSRLLLWPDVFAGEHGDKSLPCLWLSMSIPC